ncbi:glycosyltransferase [Planococcus sp. Urea-3u-39]|uniref:glycosyltransferase n=2 Tax=unclassified Planococcus (in: firmicutes) TaxID=2662419 RepID=UPI0015E13BDC|nr:glycosyltransferase family 2 protein [Planococcus sp. Urea-3u-39]
MYRKKINLSVVIASNEDQRLLSLLESMEKIVGIEYIECIIVLDADQGLFYKRVKTQLLNAKGNYKIVLAEEKSRCERKDIGVENATAEYICFVDSDCIFHSDYYSNLKPYLNHYEVIKGKVEYLKGSTWLGSMNSNYRYIADNILFVNETFTPNLVIQKNFLQKSGGWSKDNIDEQDDYILSQRLKKVMTVPLMHLEKSIVFHVEDSDFRKLKKSWLGYGEGYGFRYWIDDERSEKIEKLLKYLPPFPYKSGYGMNYFSFCIIHYFYMCLGYIKGLKKYNTY